MKLNLKQITISGILGAVSIVLGMTPIGRIPMPTGVAATIMHIPAILGGIWEGPLVGGLVGLIFGLFSFLIPSNPLFADPLVSIFPRLLIGPAAFYIFRLTRRESLAAVGGTATNTIGVLGMAALRGHLPWQATLPIAAGHGIPEIIVAVIIVVVLSRALSNHVKTG